MKRITQSLLQTMAACGVAAMIVAPAFGATYSVDINTQPSGTAQLYLNSSQVAPSGSTLWFVADTTGAGMPSGTVSVSTIQSIMNGTGPLQLIYQDTTPGGLGAFAQPGTFSRLSVQINSTFQPDPIYAVLWNDVNKDLGSGGLGDTFGTFSLGVQAPPALGNAAWNITSKMFANQNLVVVPEPATYGCVFGLLCLAGAVARRKIRS